MKKTVIEILISAVIVLILGWGVVVSVMDLLSQLNILRHVTQEVHND
jgi:hypothetical protein